MSGPSSFVEGDGFLGYVVETEETPVSYIAAVLFFVVVSIVVAAPFACCSSSEYGQHGKQPTNDGDDESSGQQIVERESQVDSQPEESPPPNIADIAVFHREHLSATKELVDAYKKKKAEKQEQAPADDTASSKISAGNDSAAPIHPSPYPQTPHFEQRRDVDQLSTVPSVASTSRLHGAIRKRPFRSRVPWGAKPLPLQATVRRSVQMERQARESEEGSHSYHSRSRTSWTSAQTQSQMKQQQPRNVSKAAEGVLEDEAVEGEAEYFRRKYVQRSRSYRRPSKRRAFTEDSAASSILTPSQHRDRMSNQRAPNRRRCRTAGSGMSDTSSIMPPLHPDVISPEDAADAEDPGMIANPTQFAQAPENVTDRRARANSGSSGGIISAQWSNLLDLAEFDYETKRILVLAIPSTVQAMADPIFRIVLMAMISHYVDTDSMVAYLLVNLFIRLTLEEVSVAITDAESNLLQDALMQGGDLGFFQAGQTIQLAIICQVALNVPVLLMWFFLMDNLVNWLVSDDQIAEIASAYTAVIVVDYIVRCASRTFMIPFYLTGQARFETLIDLGAGVLTLSVIAIVGTTTYDLSLTAIGWIQVIIGMAKIITKVSYVALRGWLTPYRRGLLRHLSLKNTSYVTFFLLQALPLFLGSLLEVGEWDILVLFVQQLGGAEVTTWAMMGVFWETFAALTEGLGEAASVRVSLYLTEGMSIDAKRLASKVSFLTFTLVLFVASIFLMAGPDIAVALTSDYTLQHLFNQLVGMVSLANVPTAFAQVYWSLAGAQGRFSLASATILICRWFIIIPISSICIFAYFYDLVAVAGAVALGYAVAAFVLACAVFRGDWQELSNSLRDDGEDCGNLENDQLSQSHNEESSSSASSEYTSSSEEGEQPLSECPTKKW